MLAHLKIAQPPRTKKITQPLGAKNIIQPLGTKKITQPLGTKKITKQKKSRNVYGQSDKGTNWQRDKLTKGQHRNKGTTKEQRDNTGTKEQSNKEKKEKGYKGILTKNPRKWVRHNQVSWSSFLFYSSRGRNRKYRWRGRLPLLTIYHLEWFTLFQRNKKISAAPQFFLFLWKRVNHSKCYTISII